MTEVKPGAYDSTHLKKLTGYFILLNIVIGVLVVSYEDSEWMYFLPHLPFFIFFIIYIARATGRDAFLGNPAFSIHKKDAVLSVLFVLINLSFAFLYASFVSIPESSMWSHISEGSYLIRIFAFALLCLIGPFTEELLFRDFLWKIFYQKNYSDRKVLILTSFIFALAHLELLRLPILFISGLLFGLLRLRTNRLGASMLAHFLTNLIAFSSVVL
ncbi:MAG: CPBP family intramembrane metalloprotease [Spirochaetales bacterium]|nr:CPBP family intramembrane metalloprotease [Spirochaetales bacterium]